MRESEIKLIFKWITPSVDGLYNMEAVRQAIQYAYKMGVTDGSGGNL